MKPRALGRLRIPTRKLGPSLAALEALLRREHLRDETVLDLRLVAEEVLTNVAKYAYDDAQPHEVELTVARDRGEVMLQFVDDGRPFDPLSAKRPDLSAPERDRSLGGFGLDLVRSLTDGAEYARQGARNVLRLRKRLAARRGDVG